MSSRPDLIGNPSTSRIKTRTFGSTVWHTDTPPLYTFGERRTEFLAWPNFFEADWSLSKGFKFTERVGLEFRWEVFNVINRQNLALPNSSGGFTCGRPYHRHSDLLNVRKWNAQYAIRRAYYILMRSGLWLSHYPLLG